MIVEGYASVEGWDDQGHFVPVDVMQRALDHFFDTGAKLKEMHDGGAKGRVLSASIDRQSLYITARVTNPVTALKVEKGILHAFSIGGRSLGFEYDDGAFLLTELILDEISLCDRPANQSCRLTYWTEE